MPFQHIFTSAQTGLSPDSSGYCTVAQTEGIPDDLVKALERLSTYDFSAKNDPHMGGHSPVVYRYQFVRVHSGTFFVISKINDAGHSNYLAQHLALSSSEIGQLQDKLADAKSRQKAIIMRQKTASSRLEVKKTLDSTKVDNAMGRFEQYERKIDDLESQVEAYDLGKKTLQDEFAELEASDKVEDELAALKAKVKGANKSTEKSE